MEKYNKPFILVIKTAVLLSGIFGVSNCIAKLDHHRIVGGLEVNAGEMPWMVFVSSVSQSTDDSTTWRVQCGGSLIERQWILTSAGCVGEFGPNWKVNLTIYLGVTNVQLPEEEESQRRVLTGDLIIPHPLFDSNNPESTFPYDIALVRLSEAIDITNFIKPIRLPLPNDTDHLNDASTVAGWGSTSDINYSPSNILLKAETKTVDSSICRRSFNSAISIDDDFFICTQGDIGTGPCSNDHGGPLMFRSDQEWIQIGIMTYAPIICKTGAAGFTRVRAHLDWIQSEIYN